MRSSTPKTGSLRDRLGLALLGPLTVAGARYCASPSLPRVFAHIRTPQRRQKRAWPRESAETNEALRTVPGIWRDGAAEREAYARGPVYDLISVHPELATFFVRFGWRWILPTLLHRLELSARILRIAREDPADVAVRESSTILSAQIHAEAARLGLSQVGFAPYDEKYTFGNAGGHETGSVIVCVLEQDWESTQHIPSPRSEREVMRTYHDVGVRAAELAAFLHTKGIHATPHGPAGPMVTINFAVEAGLGQLGLNGQLLTPAAGSRCRLLVITTDAELEHTGPVDFGVNAVCDACQLCVKRCPPGAIPLKRDFHRGVKKVKIKPERCLPTMAQSFACGICMKVCPVQRYGLRSVKEHLVATGNILGKGTDELEGYDWIDGRHYGPGEKPRLPRGFLQPEGWKYDPTRAKPLGHDDGDAEMAV